MTKSCRGVAVRSKADRTSPNSVPENNRSECARQPVARWKGWPEQQRRADRSEFKALTQQRVIHHEKKIRFRKTAQI